MMQKIILWSTCKFMSLYFQTVRVQCIINNHIFSWKPRLFLIPVIRSFIEKFCCLVCFSMHNGLFELISIVWLLLIIHYVLMADSLQCNTLPTEEKHRIVALTHKLLTKVCCSHTHGINFHDKTLGTSGKYAFLFRIIVELWLKKKVISCKPLYC